MAVSAPASPGDRSDAGGHAETPNRRTRRKSDRRLQLLSAAERLFAERGFLAVRLEDIGAAAGVSGPAIYRHFPNKESLLVELLVGISTRLLAGAREVRSRETDAARGAQRVDRLPPRLRARRTRSHSHSGPRPRSSAGRRRTAGAPSAAPIRGGMGGRDARARARTRRGRRAADGTRGVWAAQLDSTQPQACRCQGGRSGTFTGGDAGDDDCRVDRWRLLPVTPRAN